MSQNGAAGGSPESVSEPLRYGVLGDDTSPEAEKLEKYTGVVGWDYLKPHFESEALLYIDPSLDLKEVGVAITADDRPRVEAWMKSGDLVKPGAPHASHWAESGQQFKALVVSPFVLIQPADTASSQDG